jgi:hypothetical protein
VTLRENFEGRKFVRASFAITGCTHEVNDVSL